MHLKKGCTILFVKNMIRFLIKLFRVNISQEDLPTAREDGVMLNEHLNIVDANAIEKDPAMAQAVDQAMTDMTIAQADEGLLEVSVSLAESSDEAQLARVDNVYDSQQFQNLRDKIARAIDLSTPVDETDAILSELIATFQKSSDPNIISILNNAIPMVRTVLNTKSERSLRLVKDPAVADAAMEADAAMRNQGQIKFLFETHHSRLRN